MHNLTVVTGLWRCGSSMLMQILKASGVEPIHQPFYDKFNPRGYYEIDPKTSDRIHSEIVSGKYQNHCIKWLIPFWPEQGKNNIVDLGDNIIFLLRDYEEIIASTNEKFGFSPYKRRLQILERDAKNSLLEKGMKPIFLSYNEIIEDPKKGLWPIKFLLKGDWESAVKTVDSELYNWRSERAEVL